MRVDLFDFDLPEERIALRPALPRESAKLLVVPPTGGLADHRVGDLPDLLRPDDVIVLNDTRVIPAQLTGIRKRGDASARIDVTLHMRAAHDMWLAFVRPAKKLAVGDTIVFADGALSADVASKGDAGEIALRFDRGGADLDAAIASVGVLPLPPYIASRRPVDAADASDYQTSFARDPGAVAAPTAGLHMTPELRVALAERGIAAEFVTLHVGAGTFLPVKADDTTEHRMHSEIGIVDPDVAERLTGYRRSGRRIVAIGTTSLRLLESAATTDGEIRPFRDATDIFITPGYRFRAVDVLVTNFHLPRSTLFMLVSAFSGRERMQDAYRHAIDAGYRFYSYGDACLLERKDLP
ncbi:tRNA preQ1(34) S-adenosylmethionine ribosyltransferase-isomerase QueA [Aureimonas sp. AU4]|uniref:tRNA preQ1(34) S-adenosylmethionine ribosyltransferase-isomerase QueA n=1 Tax=Aureimonas sp. AU4 TaxID=1638163 RepID=UPI00070592A7|nr:tRNA preQ1(34) S-adenosylmethionine ribosyltransferase-isomerase QueA [Aureimonas sp. AU4]BAT30672.1 S-adenosylmethionine:tRNA ribosyltransferase-isomerase QueA [Aureimonas sp. AU4]